MTTGFAPVLAALPPPSDRRLALDVTPDALGQIRRGSPWLYDGSITSVRGPAEHEAAAGDLAVVFDGARRFAAIGLWDPTSPIRVKILHRGSPTPIDAGFWRTGLSRAFEARSTLASDGDTNAYRCVHGENDRLPGLVVDRYHRTLVVKLGSIAWLRHLDELLPVLVDVATPWLGEVERVVLRWSRVAQAQLDPALGHELGDGCTVYGHPPAAPVRFRERGLEFEADVVRGHKTGHFLDQRDNRALVRSMADGADVLDVFAATGGFAVSAAAGGATSVHLVDASGPALATARRNLAHNHHIRAVRSCAVRTTEGDAFEVLHGLVRRTEPTRGGRGQGPTRRPVGPGDGRYDIVVLDPPSFAANARSVPAALRSYARLTSLGVALVRSGGVLVQASCSSRIDGEEFFATVHEAARAAGVDLSEIRRTGHPADHPIGFEQGAYLKAVFARVDR